ncbi:MAG: 4-hydroxybutyrate CoA-transferase [Chlamydiae bacterium]|nr:4-hydroxybutyrate CoA-transferase [Chlamydiota bacterium]
MQKVSSPQEAVACISSGSRVFVHGGAATPLSLLDALYERRALLENVELIHIHLMGDVPHCRKDFKKSFRAVNLFVGPNVRHALNYEEIDYLPCFLSEIPQLFRLKKRPIDVALIHVSPPDRHGFCTLGTSVDVARAAVDTAPIIIAQINRQMPRIHGDGFIHVSKINYSVEVDLPILEEESPQGTELERKIGKYVASLIDDGSTLQTGIGKIPHAVLSELIHHKNLGIHTEVCSDTLLPLIECGAINNSLKIIHPGKVVSTFAIGTRKLYDFIHDNPAFVQLDVAFTNNPQIIGKNPKVVAINSAAEIDLTGQICADSVGTHIISGVGGQIDYMRGASLSKDGKAIIALSSRTNQGKSKIVSTLKKGAGVVTTRGHVHYVITEYGIADLFGKTLGERAKALINIAHPDDRTELERQWREVVSISY